MTSNTPARMPDNLSMSDRRVLTAAEVAEMLGVSPRTLARWHLHRLGPPRCKVVGKVFYRPEAIEAWLAANESADLATRKGN